MGFLNSDYSTQIILKMKLVRTHKKPVISLLVPAALIWLTAAVSTAQEPPPLPAEPNTAASPQEDQKQAAQAQEAQPPTDPNDLQLSSAKEEDIDLFNLRASSLVIIQDAYERILNPELITEDGLVDYATLRRKRADIMVAAKELETLNPAVLMSLSREERIAFWINTYNVCMIKLIVVRYPIEPKWYMILYPDDSIMQIPGAWTKVYFDIQKLEYNLKEIEQYFLLDQYKDPRICFALSYASVGGATLRNEPYRGAQLGKQLDDQVRRYLRSAKGMRLDKEKGELYLSNLFQMHKKAFLESEYASILKFRNRTPEDRAWLNFIVRYLDEDDAYYLEKNNVAIKFIEYDWHLNDLR